MGMDVYGKCPAEPQGEYFRANVWYWRPLWSYCINLHGEIADKVEHGFSNDGDGLDGDDAYDLGRAIFEDIETGIAAEYKKMYDEALAELPMKDCELCDATGIRTDEIGLKQGMNTAELPEEVAVVVGRTHGTCNACRGYGKQASFETNYPFTLECLEEFAQFLVACGGFEIC